MFGTVCHEMEVSVPASEAWNLYGSLQLAKLTAKGFPDLITKIDVVQGDGGVGTVLELFFTPETPGITSYKEKFMVVDDEKRVKESEVVEGGYLDMGFTLYRVRFEVIEKLETDTKCITKSTIEYEVKEDAAANASFVSIDSLVAIMNFAADYLIQNHNKRLT